MKPPIVIDKSYAHSSNPARLKQLSEEFTILRGFAANYERKAGYELLQRGSGFHLQSNSTSGGFTSDICRLSLSMGYVISEATEAKVGFQRMSI